MPGKGGVGAVTAFGFAAFWLDVDLEEVLEAAEDFLLKKVEAETTVLDTTTVAEVFSAAAATCDEDFLDALDAVDFAGAEEAGLEGGAFDVEDAAPEPALEGALAAEDAALETVFVTVLEEVPLMAAVVLVVVTNSLPFAEVSEPATFMSLSSAGLTGTATQGATNTGMASNVGIGGGGEGATG